LDDVDYGGKGEHMMEGSESDGDGDNKDDGSLDES
jgi:hypothetical protein